MSADLGASKMSVTGAEGRVCCYVCGFAHREDASDVARLVTVPELLEDFFTMRQPHATRLLSVAPPSHARLLHPLAVAKMLQLVLVLHLYVLREFVTLREFAARTFNMARPRNIDVHRVSTDTFRRMLVSRKPAQQQQTGCDCADSPGGALQGGLGAGTRQVQMMIGAISARVTNESQMMISCTYLLEPDAAAGPHGVAALEIAALLYEEWHAVPLRHEALCVRALLV